MTHLLRIASCTALLLATFAFSGCNSDSTPSASSRGGDSTTSESGDSSTASTQGGSATDAELGASEEDAWGTLVMNFTYGGDVPTQPSVNITKDANICGVHDLVEEWRMVNPDNKGLANVVVYMVKKPSDMVPIHKSYDATAAEPAEIDNSECRYEPHVIVMRTTQPLVIGNEDSVGHNSKGDLRANRSGSFNVNIPGHDEITVGPFPEPERLPFPVSCGVHPWMTGYVLVQDHPYAAVSDENGQLRIENLPSGTWEFQVWQENMGNVSDVTLGGEDTTWTRGRFRVTIEADAETDMGDIVIAPNAFRSN